MNKLNGCKSIPYKNNVHNAESLMTEVCTLCYNMMVVLQRYDDFSIIIKTICQHDMSIYPRRYNNWV